MGASHPAGNIQRVTVREQEGVPVSAKADRDANAPRHSVVVVGDLIGDRWSGRAPGESD